MKHTIALALSCLVITGGITSCDSNTKHAVTEENLEAKDTTIDFKSASVKSDDYEDNILPPGITHFIPAGYSLLDSSSGDLNLDDVPDIILVLKKDGEDTSSDVIEHPEKRPLLILTGAAKDIYQLEARNDNSVYCVNCGGIMGDPFQGVVIKNGFFSVEHTGGSSWRWERVVTYKYAAADRQWYLFKDGHVSYHATDPDKADEKILTAKDFGKVKFADFDIYKTEEEGK